MPTGYTAEVQSGKITGLKPFILQLARGMGALIMMRDAPADAPIPERFEPSKWNAEKLAEAETKLAEVMSMPDDMAQAASDAAYQDRSEAFERRRVERDEHRARYKAMLAKVEAWRGAPEGIKEFALEQLQSSLDFDCSPVSGDDPWIGKPKAWSGEEWRRNRIEKLHRDIAYHTKANAEEIERTEARNQWLKTLLESL